MGRESTRLRGKRNSRQTLGMYRIDDDFDPSFFVGAMVQRVCFGPYVVTLDLDGSSVTIEGSYEHRDGGRADEVTLPTADSRLMRLSGKRVESAHVDDPETLRLEFDDGQSLRIFDRSDEYESFKVDRGDVVWVF